jgi:hypothetical protein
MVEIRPGAARSSPQARIPNDNVLEWFINNEKRWCATSWSARAMEPLAARLMRALHAGDIDIGGIHKRF